MRIPGQACVFSTPCVELAYQRIYPTRATADVRLNFPPNSVELSRGAAGVTEALNALRHKEEQQILHDANIVRTECLRNLDSHGRSVSMEDCPGAIQAVQRSWTAAAGTLLLHPATAVIAMDYAAHEEASDASIAEQMLSAAVRMCLQALKDHYNDALLREIQDALRR